MNSKILCCYVLLMLVPLVLLQECREDKDCNGEDAAGTMCCRRLFGQCGNMTESGQRCGWGLFNCPCKEGYTCRFFRCREESTTTTMGTDMPATTSTESSSNEEGGSAE